MVDCRIGGVEQERMSIACGKNYIGHRWEWSKGIGKIVCRRCYKAYPVPTSILNGKPIPKELVVEGYPELEWEFGFGPGEQTPFDWHVKTIIDDNC